jgi:hypothetical protein
MHCIYGVFYLAQKLNIYHKIWWGVLMQLDNLPVYSLTKIAWALFDAHGENAFVIANQTIFELENEGHPIAADAWRSVKILIDDVINGRIDREAPTIH